MSEHSKEPWVTYICCDGPVVVNDADGNAVCGYFSSFDGINTPVFSSVEDLTRIAACVNFCDGVEGEVLAMGSIGDFVEAKLQAQQRFFTDEAQQAIKTLKGVST